MKDKLRIEDMLDAAYNEKTEVMQNESDIKANVIAALTALGYSGIEAGRAIGKVAGWQDMDEEQLLKAALKNIM